jgi:peptide/nickel transport system permease protein
VSGGCCRSCHRTPSCSHRQNLLTTLSGPSHAHLLGTGRLGRDVLSRLLYGGRVSLLGLVEALAVALVIGIVFGLIAGYSRRFTDNVISRGTEIVTAIRASWCC